MDKITLQHKETKQMVEVTAEEYNDSQLFRNSRLWVVVRRAEPKAEKPTAFAAGKSAKPESAGKE